MSLKNIFTEKYSFSLSDANYVLITAIVLYLIYTVHQLDNLTSTMAVNISTVNQEIQILKRENDTLRELLGEKNDIILELLDTRTTSHVISDDMSKFYFKAAGIVVIGCLVLYITNSTFTGFFSMKKLLPVKAYSIIQSYTPFFQEHKTYTHHDALSKTDWIIDILNDKTVTSIKVKSDLTADFIPVSELIKMLEGNSRIMVPYSPSGSGDFVSSLEQAVIHHSDIVRSVTDTVGTFI